MNNYNFDALKFAVEGISGGANTIIMDNVDLPSFMVPVYKRTNAQLFTGGSEHTHPAFIVDEAEYSVFYFSQFINCVVDGRAYSWPLVDPAASLNYDTAHNYCNKKGAGWHLGSIPEWAVINHLIRKSGFEPHGNTNFGKAYQHDHETGAITYSYTEEGVKKNGRTATGSGPATWRHDGTFAGIADWVGDVWKWMSGMRIVNSEIQVFVGNLAAKQTAHGNSSTFWKAILPNGSLVAPGTSGTLKYTKAMKIGTSTGEVGTNSMSNFGNVVAETGVTIPELLYALNLAPVPADKDKYKGGFWINNDGERLPFVGASWSYTSSAGSSALSLGGPRSYVCTDLGFFSAFMEL